MMHGQPSIKTPFKLFNLCLSQLSSIPQIHGNNNRNKTKQQHTMLFLFTTHNPFSPPPPGTGKRGQKYTGQNIELWQEIKLQSNNPHITWNTARSKRQAVGAFSPENADMTACPSVWSFQEGTKLIIQNAILTFM